MISMTADARLSSFDSTHTDSRTTIRGRERGEEARSRRRATSKVQPEEQLIKADRLCHCDHSSRISSRSLTTTTVRFVWRRHAFSAFRIRSVWNPESQFLVDVIGKNAGKILALSYSRSIPQRRWKASITSGGSALYTVLGGREITHFRESLENHSSECNFLDNFSGRTVVIQP